LRGSASRLRHAEASLESLRPHIEKLISAMRRDPFIAGFVAEAVGKFSKAVLKADPDKITKSTNGWVTGEEWQRAAAFCLASMVDDPQVLA
jgi:hypothetical protein